VETYYYLIPAFKYVRAGDRYKVYSICEGEHVHLGYVEKLRKGWRANSAREIPVAVARRTRRIAAECLYARRFGALGPHPGTRKPTP